MSVSHTAWREEGVDTEWRDSSREGIREREQEEGRTRGSEGRRER